ncbi:MAG: DUF1080 domain-containing protein [Pirellulales bacterium]
MNPPDQSRTKSASVSEGEEAFETAQTAETEADFVRLSRWALATVLCVVSLLSSQGRLDAAAPDDSQAVEASSQQRESQTDTSDGAAASKTDRQTEQVKHDGGQAKGDRPVILFDGKTLRRWQITDFAGHGEVVVRQGRMILDMGTSLTGVTYQDKIPLSNYEVSLEAMRVAGTDFFCGLTFPVGDSHCSLIVGGWGGTIVGLSSVNNYDASENETTQYLRFHQGRWYAIRVRVSDEKIEAWIDGDQIVDLPRKERTFSVRIEVEPSRPFGIASWQTRAAVRKIELRRLGPAGR